MQYLEAFREFDIFGTIPIFYIDKKKKSGTICGLLITILAFFAYFACGIYYFSDIFDKTNVKSYTSVRNPTIPLSINFTSDKFYFGFAIQDPISYGFILDESIYYVKAFYKVATRQEDGNFSWEVEPVELERCQSSKFNSRYKELFEKRNINNLYCIKNFTYNIEGTFLHDKYSFIIFDFYQCKNSTENGNKCKPQEKIDYYLNSTFVAVEFTDISVDSSNYTHPITPLVGETYSTIGHNFYKEMHIYLKSVLFKSDIGLLFTNIQEGNYLQLDYVNDMFALKVKEMFCSFSLKISNKIEVYERSYTKFQATLVNIGGVIQGISTMGMIVTFFYNKTSYDLALTNHIFKVSTNSRHISFPNRQKTKSSKNIKSTINTGTFQSSQSYSVKSKDSRTINKYSVPSKFKRESSLNEETLFQKNIKHHPIHLSFITMCLSQMVPQCFSKNTKTKLLYKGTSIIEDQLDIITIVKEAFNNMKIRKMLLSKIQYQLFNSNSYPELSLSDDKNKTKLEFEFKNIKSMNMKIKRKMLELLKKENNNKIINDSIFLSNFT